VTDSDRTPPAHINGHAKKSYAPALRAVAETAEHLRRIDQQIIDRVRERPLVAVGLALATGYVLGRMFSRWG
jgi:ElaB/YqjD/DUF883 family membrane-anchored ribosome-binding protein